MPSTATTAVTMAQHFPSRGMGLAVAVMATVVVSVPRLLAPEEVSAAAFAPRASKILEKNVSATHAAIPLREVDLVSAVLAPLAIGSYEAWTTPANSRI